MRKRIPAFLLSLLMTSSMVVTASAVDGGQKDVVVNINGITASDAKVYGATIVWEEPTFNYKVDGEATARWDPDTHTYSTGSAINGSFDKTSVAVKVYNHSNAKVDATCYVGADANTATTTSYKVSNYDVNLAVSNPAGEVVTMAAAEPESAIDSVTTQFTLTLSGDELDKYAAGLVAKGNNKATVGVVVVSIEPFQVSADTCEHTAFNSATGICGDCDTFVAVATVTPANSNTQAKVYYLTVDEAVAAASNKVNSTLALARNVELGADVNVTVNSGTFTIDWKGFTLTGSTWKSLLNISGTANLVLTDSVGGGGIANVGTTAMEAVKISGGDVHIKAGNYTPQVRRYGGTLKLSGGVFNCGDGKSFAIYTEESGTLSELVADGYALKYVDEDYFVSLDIYRTDAGKPVYVVPHEHSFEDGISGCVYCGFPSA